MPAFLLNSSQRLLIPPIKTINNSVKAEDISDSTTRYLLHELNKHSAGGVDAGNEHPAKRGCGEGCSTSGDKLPAGELAFIGLMLLALARRMRRVREKSIMENRPIAPGGILLNHMKRKIGGYFEGLRK